MENLKTIGIALMTVAFLVGYIKWKLCATVLSAWIFENEYTPPTDEDMKRLIEWVVRRKIKDITKR